MACSRLPTCTALAFALGLLGCQPDPAEVSPSTGSTGTSGTSTSTTTGSTGPDPSTGMSTNQTSEGSGTSSTGPLDGSSGSSGSTGDSGSSEESSTGEPSTVGCADGLRDALEDEAAYPQIAACAGGFGVPGINVGAPLCDRQGGDDNGALADGMGCSIEDLCAAGWHVCVDLGEVAAKLPGGCGGVTWSNQFFATRQSGEGSNTCNPTGTNDVFGCGDIGYTDISGCAPLNRSTGNLCANISGPWQCDEDAYDEVSHIIKTGSTHGGALCCVD